MIGVEHLDGVRQVLVDLALLAPRQAEQRVDVIAHDRRLGRHRRHHLELLELAQRLGLGFLRHLGGLDLLVHLVEIGVLVALAKLLLDRLDLLVQVVLALALFHLPLDSTADALLDLKDVDLAFEQTEQVLEPLADVLHFEDFLLLLELQRQVRGNRVGQPAAIVDARHRRQDFRRNLLVELDVLVELPEQRAAHRLDLVRAVFDAGQQGRFGGQVFARIRHADDSRALRALDQHFDRAVRQLQHLEHRRHAADVVQIVGRGLVLGRGLLGDQQDVLARFHRHVERLDRLRAADEQRDDHVREYDDIPQRKKREDRQLGYCARQIGCHAAASG